MEIQGLSLIPAQETEIPRVNLIVGTDLVVGTGLVVGTDLIVAADLIVEADLIVAADLIAMTESLAIRKSLDKGKKVKETGTERNPPQGIVSIRLRQNLSQLKSRPGLFLVSLNDSSRFYSDVKNNFQIKTCVSSGKNLLTRGFFFFHLSSYDSVLAK